MFERMEERKRLNLRFKHNLTEILHQKLVNSITITQQSQKEVKAFDVVQ